MKETLDVKGILFDFGGTLDTNGCHWGRVLWQVYRHFSLPVEEEAYRAAYVYGERKLATQPLIYPDFHLVDVLRTKLGIQLDYLDENGLLLFSQEKRRLLAGQMSVYANSLVQDNLKQSRSLLCKLSGRYRLALVSNFYGNLCTVLEDARLDALFDGVVESAVVGVRKPDPAIFALGIRALGLPASEVAVVGDSYRKDMMPARRLGCRTVWLRGEPWECEEVDERLVDRMVTDLADLVYLFDSTPNPALRKSSQ